MKMQKFYNLLFLSVGYEEHKNVSFSPNEYLGCCERNSFSLCVSQGIKNGSGFSTMLVAGVAAYYDALELRGKDVSKASPPRNNLIS